MTDKRKLTFVGLCDDEVGEVEGFFDENGDLIACWANNDASWRGEYMDGLLAALGYEVEYPDENDPAMVDELKEVFGY